MTVARPDAIDTRLVFRLYAAIVGGAGLLAYSWPLRFVWPNSWAQWLMETPDLPGIPWGRFAVVRIGATVLVAAGLCGLIFATISDTQSRRRALMFFGIAHIVTGLMASLQWQAVFSEAVPQGPVLLPHIAGLLLLYFAFTADEADPQRRVRSVITLLTDPPDSSASERLRSQDEEQIARAARQEERARLARDLHDAVKQQLFVIHTAAATTQARLDHDAPGAREAVEQIRTAAREAGAEMEALLDQLQAPPLTNAGLTDALRKQCDALKFRTGAEVTFIIDPLPPDWAMPPGTSDALNRVAQEVLANVARHARAGMVTVRLDVVAGRLSLTIRDNGTGFDPDTVARGIGRNSMRVRAEEAGGAFELWSRPGKGTMVKITLPYETMTPREFRNKAIAWTAGAAVGWVTYALPTHLGGGGILHFVFSIAAVITAARYAVAFNRLRRRAGVTA